MVYGSGSATQTTIEIADGNALNLQATGTLSFTQVGTDTLLITGTDETGTDSQTLAYGSGTATQTTLTIADGNALNLQATGTLSFSQVGTDTLLITGAVPAKILGTVTDSSLRYDGSDFVENTQLLSNGTDQTTIKTNLSITGTNTTIDSDVINLAGVSTLATATVQNDLAVTGESSLATTTIADNLTVQGNVGIGISSPKTQLDLSGDLRTDTFSTDWLNNSNGGAYAVSDVVVYQGALYRNLLGANTDTTPNVDVTNWRNLDTPFARVTNELLFDDGSTSGYLYVSLVINNAWQVTRFKKDDPNDEGVANIGNNSGTTAQPTTLALCQGLTYTP